jgi:hypothetical protein
MNGPRVDLTGRTFARLTVERAAPHAPYTKRRWVCRCACGKRTVVRVDHLLTGKVRSCGCLVRRDLRGQTLGDLLILSRASNIDAGRSLHHPKGLTAWRCRCIVCRREVIVGTAQLLRNAHPSCGCRFLKPSAEPADEADTAIETDDAPRRQPVPDPLPVLTPEMRAAGYHQSQLGITRTVARSVEDDDDEPAVLSDGDPWV